VRLSVVAGDVCVSGVMLAEAAPNDDAEKIHNSGI
jgi:hypothetical protein